MSGLSEGALSVNTILFFVFVLLVCTVLIIKWLNKGSNEILKSQNRGSNVQQNSKRKSSISSKQQQQQQHQPKKKVVIKQSSKGSAAQTHKFEHPHLVSTLKGHTGQLTGGDFSSSGKQFITAAEVARAFVIPNVEDENETIPSHFKAINHDEKGTMWSTDSLSSSSNTPSDTEDSLTSSSSCSLKMSRRQKKNKKRKKCNISDKNSVKMKSKSCANNNSNTNNSSSNINNNSNNSNNNFKKSDKNKLVDNEIIIESVMHKEKKSKKCKFGQNVCNKVNSKVHIDFHKLLLPFCTNVQERILSGFPYQTYRGTYVFKSFGFSRVESVLGDHRLVDAEITDDLKDSASSMDEDDEEVSSNNFMRNNVTVNDFSSLKYKSFYNNSGNVQKCERCRQFFDVGQNGRTLCIFHPKKAILTSEGALRYICCNSFKNGGGCQAYTFHVYHHLSIGINGPLERYISTQPLKRAPKVFGLDCEMVFTTQGFEVARTTLVDVYGEVVLDIFVHPEGIILDYNTQFSGITEESLFSASSFSEMQNLFLQYVSSSDILVGHSLDGDLVVLKILHRRVVDSSLLFLDMSRDTTTNGSSPLPRRQPLKSLVKQHLGQDIQVSGPSGHNSKEDATASLYLVLNKICGESFKEVQRGSKLSIVPGL